MFRLLLAVSAAIAAERVEIVGSSFVVDGKNYSVRGVCYSPVPIGESVNWDPNGDYFTPNYAYIWKRDLRMIKELGANTIRIYGWNNAVDHSAFLDEVQQNGLMVMITYYLGTSADNPVRHPFERDAVVKRFVKEVSHYSNHPAVLLWSFGNELNGWWNGFMTDMSDESKCGWTSDICQNRDNTCRQAEKCVYTQLFQFIEHACAGAATVTTRPCVSGMADVDGLVDNDLTISKVGQFDSILPHVKAWAVQIYRGNTFGTFFDDYKKASSKPLIITEYGVDAYNDNCGWPENTNWDGCFTLPLDNDRLGGDVPRPDGEFVGCTIGKECAKTGVQSQAEYDLHLAELLQTVSSAEHRGVVAGGFVMSWSDEYWKGYKVDGGCASPCGITPSEVARCRGEQQDDFKLGGKATCAWKSHFTCSNWDSSFHDVCGYALDAFPDHYVNEEWFGITAPDPCVGKKVGDYGSHRLDVFTPRPAYISLRSFWAHNDTVPWLETCQSIDACYECSVTHTAQEILTGACNRACFLHTNLTAKDFYSLGETFAHWTIGATAIVLIMPFIAYCWAQRKKEKKLAHHKLHPKHKDRHVESLRAKGRLDDGPLLDSKARRQADEEESALRYKPDFSVPSPFWKPPFDMDGLTTTATVHIAVSGAMSLQAPAESVRVEVCPAPKGPTSPSSLSPGINIGSLPERRELGNHDQPSQSFIGSHFIEIQPFTFVIVKAPAEAERFDDQLRLQEHVELQCETVTKQLQHEIRNNHDLVQALTVLHYRTLENYECWLEKQQLQQLDVDRRLLAEVVLVRVLSSLAEHILHCPERMAMILHCTLARRQHAKEPYLINLAYLQEGLDRVHGKPTVNTPQGTPTLGPETQLNFDDINQCALQNTSRLRKPWHESPGVVVYVDILRNYYPILFLKGWIFAAVLYTETKLYHSRPPFFATVPYWTEVAHIDASTYFLIEFFLFVYSVFIQERGESWKRRSWHRVAGIALATVSLLWVWVPTQTLKTVSPLAVLVVYALFFRFFLFLIYLPAIERWVGRASSFQTNGRPRMARRITRDMKLWNSDTDEFDNRKAICYMLMEPLRTRKGNWGVIPFWTVIFALTFLVEMALVSPIGLGFTLHPLCDKACPGMRSISELSISDGQCSACVLSLVLIYVLVGLACLVDLFLIFNAVIAVTGYVVGIKRGLLHLLTVRRAVKFPPPSSTSISRATALVNMFGTHDHARDAWSKICESLLDRDLITDAQLKSLTTVNLFDPSGSKDVSHFLSALSREPRERVVYFLNSISGLVRQSPRDVFRSDGTYSEADFLRSIPTISQLITTYDETILNSEAFLKGRTGTTSNMEYLVDKYKREWDNFAHRMAIKHLINHDESMAKQLLDSFLSGDCSAELVREIRLWASFRNQTLAKTIRGALVYHEALNIRLGWAARQKDPCELKLGDMVELIISAQTYGHNRQGNEGAKERRDDMDFLLRMYDNYPITVVYDVNYEKPDSEDKELIDRYMQAQHGISLPGGKPLYLTCMRRFNSATGQLEMVRILPRRHPLRLGSGHLLTQGKAANHLNSTRALWGHVTQVMDANMDGFLAEGFKVPFVTHLFLDNQKGKKGGMGPRGASKDNIIRSSDPPGKDRVEMMMLGGPNANLHREMVAHRIIGFREYIFTQRLGGVAGTMASSETTFGTIFQRALHDPLGVRMHYGHPDFFDTFWVINRGGLSKASPNINLSEDIFAGYNTWIRGEDTIHVDTLEWHKGREAVFTTSALFLSKISGGAVGILRTRDMMHMNYGLSILHRLSLLCGGGGYFLAMKMLSVSIFLYAAVFFLFSVARIGVKQVALFDSTLSAQWVIGFGMCSALPFLFEQILERGPIYGILQFVREYFRSTVFYLFQNQAVASAVGRGIITGKAEYQNTGRPSFFTPYTKAYAYRLFVDSHYYPALTVMWLYSYRVALEGKMSDTLVVVMVIIGIWLIAPVWFCPQISDATAFKNDWMLTLRFLFTIKRKDDWKGKEEQAGSLLGFWLEGHNKTHSLDEPLAVRIADWCVMVVQCLVMMALDSPGPETYYYGGHAALWAIFATVTGVGMVLFPAPKRDNNNNNNNNNDPNPPPSKQRKCGLAFLVFGWVVGPLIIVGFLVIFGLVNKLYGDSSVMAFFVGLPAYSPSAQFLIKLVTVVLILRVLLNGLLIFLAFCITKLPSMVCGAKEGRLAKVYPMISEFVFLSSYAYHLHFYSALMVFVVQLVVGVVLLVFGILYNGIMSCLCRSRQPSYRRERQPLLA